MRDRGKPKRRRRLPLLAAAALIGIAGCGDDETTTAAAPTTTTGAVSTATIPDEGPAIAEAPGAGSSGGEGQAGGEGPPVAQEDGTPGGDEGAGVSERDRLDVSEAEEAYRAYVDAVNARDGAALCRLLDPSFTDELELPVGSGSCAERLNRSIGFRDPRGTPVWKRTFLSGTESALLRQGDGVQLSTAIVTKFRGGSEPSVESDIAYLSPAPAGDRWILAKAPGSLWRAVGKPDVPPSVITPPPGF